MPSIMFNLTRAVSKGQAVNKKPGGCFWPAARVQRWPITPSSTTGRVLLRVLKTNYNFDVFKLPGWRNWQTRWQAEF